MIFESESFLLRDRRIHKVVFLSRSKKVAYSITLFFGGRGKTDTIKREHMP